MKGTAFKEYGTASAAPAYRGFLAPVYHIKVNGRYGSGPAYPGLFSPVYAALSRAEAAVSVFGKLF